jgi:serine/threonine-protein kinase RsbW
VQVNRTASRSGGQGAGSGATRGGLAPQSAERGDSSTGPPDAPVPDPSGLPNGSGHRHGDTPRGDTVVLTLPASSAYLSVLRTATAGLAARLQFTLDEIEDLRIAVDEACAMLLAGGESIDDDLVCRFELSADRITVTVSVPAATPALPSRDTFAWQVLTALAGAVEASVAEGLLTIQLTKRRGRTP